MECALSLQAAGIADVAVEMGPRNRRRLTGAGVSLAVLVALIVGLTQLPRLASNPGAGSATHSGTTPVTYGHLLFGMTPKQVERVAGGKPSTIRGNCWIYRAKAGTLNGLPTRTVGSLFLGQP